mgnify:CR=1 FL=1
MKKIIFLISFLPFVNFSQELTELLPTTNNGELINHSYYSLSYNVDYKQAEWVFYEIKKERILGLVGRTSDFIVDEKVKTNSSNLDDYRSSGYDRGHLAPSADFSYNSIAMSESFYMSNISPQHPSFNRGIWKSLEKLVRSWGANSSIFVVTGPVLNSVEEYIGNKVGVPKEFYKVIYNPIEQKMIAFILSNKKGEHELSHYVYSVDEVENITGIDFFPKLEDKIENELESESKKEKWLWGEVKTEKTHINEEIQKKPELAFTYEMWKTYKDSLDFFKDSLKKCRQIDNKSSPLEKNELINPGKHYALIIAVSDYKNEKDFPDLDEPVKDGEKLKMVLDRYYQFEKVEILPNPTKAAITRKLDGFVEDVSKNDNFLLFYAGHGDFDDHRGKKMGYWCPRDAEKGNSSTLLYGDEILRLLTSIPAKNTLLLADACHAITITKTRSTNPAKSEIIQELNDTQSALFISSGIDSEVPDKSVFMKELISGLKSNTDDYLQSEDLYYNFLKEAYTKVSGKKIVQPQKSELDWHEKGGDFIFIKK